MKAGCSDEKVPLEHPNTSPMYTHYFGLIDKPFSIVPDLSFLYMSEQHREALNHLLYGISSDDCFTLLTGNVGVGKSSVCRCLLTQLPENTDVAVVENPCLSVCELLSTVCKEFGVKLDRKDDEKVLLDALNSYLQDTHTKGRVAALIVDEAQNTSLNQLELLCSLATLNSDNKQLLKLVLIGQTELSQILNQQDASQISKYITTRYHLLPLDRKNCSAYVRHKLTTAGEKEKIFSKAALSRVFELSHGIPRFIDVLCDKAMEITRSLEKYMVTGRDVDTAAEKVFGGVVEKKIETTRKQLWTKVLCGLILFMVGGGALSWYFSQQTTGAPSSSESATVVVVSPELVEPVGDPVAVEVETVKTVETVDTVEGKAPEKTSSTIRIVPLEIAE